LKKLPHCDWLPAWLGTLSAAVWVSDPDGDIVFMNAEAASLMGREAGTSAGTPCHSIVRGTNACGVPLCRDYCAVRMLAGNHAKIAPIRMRVPGQHGRWIQVLIIALTAPDGSYPWLVHCASDVERTDQIERRLLRLAA
jgi:PAS domain-containing protein